MSGYAATKKKKTTTPNRIKINSPKSIEVSTMTLGTTELPNCQNVNPQEPETEDRPAHAQKLTDLSPEQKAHLSQGRSARQDVPVMRARRSRHAHENNLQPPSLDRKIDGTMQRRHGRKRRSTEKMGATVVS